MNKLQQSITEITERDLSEFQRKVWKELVPFLTKLNTELISDDSTLDYGLGIALFLRFKGCDFIFHISITKHVLYINSRFFDIYVYPEEERNKISLILSEVFNGHYTVRLTYNQKKVPIHKTFVFDKSSLEEFDERNHLFKKNKKTSDHTMLIRGEKLIITSSSA